MKLTVVRRAPSAEAQLAAGLNPVLARAYAARGVRTAADLDTSTYAWHLLDLGRVEDAVTLFQKPGSSKPFGSDRECTAAQPPS